MRQMRLQAVRAGREGKELSGARPAGPAFKRLLQPRTVAGKICRPCFGVHAFVAMAPGR